MNAVVYTGIAHSVNYIYFLIKNYDFKITHYVYSQEKDLDKLNKFIKKNSYKEISNLFFPEKLIQCIDINNFPENFS